MGYRSGTKTRRWRPAPGAAALLLALLAATAQGQATRPAGLLSGASLADGQVTLIAGRSVLLTASAPLKRVSISDPEVATARAVDVKSILLTPRKAGSTQLIAWDEQDRSEMIDVVVQTDLKALRDQYRTLFPRSEIEPVPANGSIILRGRVESAEVAEQAAQVAGPYAAKVVNLLEISGGQQVMLHVRFAEVSRSATTALGVNLGFSDGSSLIASNIGQVSPLGLGKEALAGAVTPSVTVFGRASMGDSSLLYFIEAMRRNNLLRILAEPNLMAMSGQEASFLAGGEFPVPVTGASETGGDPSVTVEFREFGVKLLFVPTVMGDGRIRLKVAPEVSDLDFTTSVRFGGYVIPGLTQRKVTTTIELADGQTFAIAGLLNNAVTASKDVTPVLGDLPVVGSLFRSVRYQRKETELVVLVTPRVAAAMNPGEVPPVPGEAWRHPTERELLLKGDIGGPETAKAPRFYGRQGFSPAATGPGK